jgi:hypothetical protein
MAMDIENKKLTKNSLESLLYTIEENTATAVDYQSLDEILSTMGINSFLIEAFQENHFESFDDFINYRKRDKKFIDSNRVAKLLGVLRGVIKFINSSK